MAAVTPTAVKRENLGSLTLITAAFASPNTGDTWASGVTSIFDYWYQIQTAPTTQASAGANITLSGSTFTIRPGEDGKAGKLFILARG